jgi:hypothetical protein
MVEQPANRRLVASFAAWSALVLGAFVAAFSLPIDDFWLSLASARAMAQGADPARAIDLTWTPMLPGALNPQWAAQVMLGLPGSLAWALGVNAALIGIGLAVTAYRSSRRASPSAAAVAMLLAIGVLAPHLLARAQSFSIALLPVALLLLERRPAPRWLPLVYGVLLAAWANLHGAFVIGQLAAAAFFVGAIIGRLRGDRDAPAVTLGVTVVAAGVAPLLNPSGPALLVYAYAQPGLDVVRSISVEWQPSWPWISVATLFWVYVVLLVLGRILRRGAVASSEAVLGLLLAGLAIGAIRQIPWFVLAFAPTLAADVDALLASRPRLAGAVGRIRGPLGDARALTWVTAAVLVVALFQPLRLLLPPSVARITPDAPVEIANRLDAVLPPPGVEPARILNEQVWGGYLAFRLGDRIETAMDGRLEIRDRATWAAYFALLRGSDDPVARLAEAGVTWAALNDTRFELVAKLQAGGWEVVLDAPEGLLLRRP